MQEKAIECLSALELKPGATFREVKNAYRDLSTIWHPDRQPDRLKSRATEKLTDINLAYEWLSKNQHALSELTKSTAKSVDNNVIRCTNCHTRNRITPTLSPGVYFRKYTCKACNEFLFLMVRCRKCSNDKAGTAIRVYQGAEPGRYRCKNCETSLFGIIVCEKCHTKNCMAPSDGNAKPVCTKCREFLLPRHRKKRENRHIIYAIGGAIIGAILGALGS